MKKIGLISVILVVGFFLTGCCCGGYVTPLQPQCSSSVTVVADSSEVYGEIVVNGQRTGKYILPGQSITIHGVLCNEVATISIVDNCGYWSHEEYVYITPGSNNYAVFSYWADYWDGPNGSYKGQNNCHCKSRI